MKKIVFILLILSLASCAFAQKFDFKTKAAITHTVDLSVLSATTAYWVLAPKVEPDKVIHLLVGYFSTQAMYYLLEPLDLPVYLKIGTPILVFGGLALFKELADSQFDKKDFYAGMIGCGLSVVSFNLVFRF